MSCPCVPLFRCIVMHITHRVKRGGGKKNKILSLLLFLFWFGLPDSPYKQQRQEIAAKEGTGKHKKGTLALVTPAASSTNDDSFARGLDGNLLDVHGDWAALFAVRGTCCCGRCRLGVCQFGEMLGPDPPHEIVGVVLVLCEPELALFGNDVEDLKRKSHQYAFGTGLAGR